MSHRFRRWSIWAHYQGKDWQEICCCDNELVARELGNAMYLKGYERVALADNYQQFVRDDGRIDVAGFFTKVLGAKFVRTKPMSESAP